MKKDATKPDVMTIAGLVGIKFYAAQFSGVLEAEISEIELGAFAALYRQALLSAQAAQPAQIPGWQDIATAPRDGFEVIVMYMHVDTQIVHNAFYASEEDGWDIEDVGWWSYDKSEVSRIKLDGWMAPTHYMPLPAAPTTSQKEKT